MNPRVGLGILWTAVGGLAAAAAVVSYRYATFQADNFYGQQSSMEVKQWQIESVIAQLVGPFLLTACLTALLTIILHATLWRRANLTPQAPPSR